VVGVLATIEWCLRCGWDFVPQCWNRHKFGPVFKCFDLVVEVGDT